MGPWFDHMLPEYSRFYPAVVMRGGPIVRCGEGLAGTAPKGISLLLALLALLHIALAMQVVHLMTVTAEDTGMDGALLSSTQALNFELRRADAK